MKRSLFVAAFLVLLGAGCQGSASITPTATAVPATTKSTTAPAAAKPIDATASVPASVTITDPAAK